MTGTAARSAIGRWFDIARPAWASLQRLLRRWHLPRAGRPSIDLGGRDDLDTAVRLAALTGDPVLRPHPGLTPTTDPGAVLRAALPRTVTSARARWLNDRGTVVHEVTLRVPHRHDRAG